MRNLHTSHINYTSSPLKRNVPVFKINRRTIVKFEVWIVENSFPIPNTPLENNVSDVAHKEQWMHQELTVLQPLTSICVSSSVHFFRWRFSGAGAAPREADFCSSDVTLRILPFFSGTRGELVVTCDSTAVSSLKLQVGTSFGD